MADQDFLQTLIKQRQRARGAGQSGDSAKVIRADIQDLKNRGNLPRYGAQADSQERLPFGYSTGPVQWGFKDREGPSEIEQLIALKKQAATPTLGLVAGKKPALGPASPRPTGSTLGLVASKPPQQAIGLVAPKIDPAQARRLATIKALQGEAPAKPVQSLGLVANPLQALMAIQGAAVTRPAATQSDLTQVQKFLAAIDPSDPAHADHATLAPEAIHHFQQSAAGQGVLRSLSLPTMSDADWAEHRRQSKAINDFWDAQAARILEKEQQLAKE